MPEPDLAGVTIRRERAGDANQIRDVVIAAFKRPHSLEVVDASDEPLVFLEGSPAFYPRFGFEPASTYRLTAPSVRIPDAAFMVRRPPTYESWMTGALVYPDPLWRHDCVGRR